ncbi:IclR family transcriptional regulator [soil metagenome]
MNARLEIESVATEPAPLQLVKTLGKALSLLDWVAKAEHPITVGALAQRSGFSRPTTYRLVNTLVAAGFLEQNAVDGRLTIGYGILPLAASLLDTNRLRIEALPHLQSLAATVNSRVNLGVLHLQKIMILAGGEKPSLPTVRARFGQTVPVHTCALGKAILSGLPTEEVKVIIAAQPLVPRTPHTITTLPALLDDLARIRKRGYSTELRENTLTSCCIGVPIFNGNDQPVAAISVSGRSLEALEKDIEHVLGTAELISHLVF